MLFLSLSCYGRFLNESMPALKPDAPDVSIIMGGAVLDRSLWLRGYKISPSQKCMRPIMGNRYARNRLLPIFPVTQIILQLT